MTRSTHSYVHPCVVGNMQEMERPLAAGWMNYNYVKM